MKNLRIILMTLLALVLMMPAAVLSAAPPMAGEGGDSILVAFRPGTAASEIAELNRNNSATVRDSIPALGVQVLSFAPGKAAGMLKVYQNNPNVVYAELDATAAADEIPNDTYTAQQWGLTKVNATDAWAITTGSAAILIAIIDSGIDMKHPDLAAKIVGSVNYSTSSTDYDVKGHGTHVAGIAAAVTNNGIGVAGMGYNSSILNVKVLGDGGTGSYSAIAKGIIWAADNGADVINMSLSGTSASSTLENAVNYAWNKGVVVVTSAGNNGNSTPVYPAYYVNSFAVASTDSADRLSSFSNRGDWVDIAAPGSSIYATLMNNTYGYKSGTSMSAPFVSGLAALVMAGVSDSNSNGRLNDEVRSIIEASADNIGVSGIGAGRINAAAAVAGLSGTAPTPAPAPEPVPTPSPVPEQPVIKAMWVSDISFTQNGKNFVVKTQVVGDTGFVAGTDINLKVTLDSKVWYFSGVTDGYGIFAFTIAKAPAGSYQVSVSGLTMTGYLWDESQGINMAVYVLGTASPGKSGK
jgi:thermitase